ncbi:MAG: pyridoxal phosphate-dependent aminotransferase [Candidatus Neomarinimicrobiota bacterium]|nr:MAG: pyridoxal phosphate-dependent aminotransferase [Candidatus Neomarinimicrobiota bacterium]
MPISSKISENLTHSSWIRKMFETGIILKKQYGSENVFDFSLGNPDLPSPPEFDDVLADEVKEKGCFVHGYMPNAGYPETRIAVADMLRRESDLGFTKNNVIMTCGAAGALNVILKSVLESGDEVIVIAPYFPEYDFYIDNHLGVKVESQSTEDFLPNLDDLDAKINSRTRAVLINSPNNPTGRIYPSETLTKLGELLLQKSENIGHPIYLLADEPYKKIVYDGLRYITPFRFYKNTILATSFSKDLSLAGERIGYLAVSPLIEDFGDIINAAIFCNRILGYINAPALMQRVIRRVLYSRVDVSIYQRRRDILYNVLKKIGYNVIKPEGTFYIFPKSPIADDIEFVKALQEKRILVTPGSGFHRSGYFRISFCVSEQTINRALVGFEETFKEYR